MPCQALPKKDSARWATPSRVPLSLGSRVSPAHCQLWACMHAPRVCGSSYKAYYLKKIIYYSWFIFILTNNNNNNNNIVKFVDSFGRFRGIYRCTFLCAMRRTITRFNKKYNFTCLFCIVRAQHKKKFFGKKENSSLGKIYFFFI